ncbi:hypothetical protein IJG78_01885 [Candidatus Saccharibacteria bacterium]|nr:hypothetical protein [Candidatus Saccharibacteria bacterium]
MEALTYWQKNIDPKKYQELNWNIPERKFGQVTILGGNSQSFSTVIHCSEFLTKNYPLENLRIVLPDVIRDKLPPLDNIIFTPSTDTGSFAKSNILTDTIKNTDFNIFIGDFSKNSATTIAITEAIKEITSPFLITRDTIDLLLSESESILEHGDSFLVITMAQLQKLFRAVYYPKMLLLSMPLMQVVETLHKFTLSYPTTIITFQQEKIIIASSGKVVTVPIESTSYSPITLWTGDLACKIAMMNLYNPKKPIDATLAAMSNQ